MIRFPAVLLLVVALGSAACTSNCDNAGVTVDGAGNIIVRGEDGFISPNSTLLKSISTWPAPPQGEQTFAFSQGYTLSRDGSTLYLLQNTAQHPNLVYRVSLSTGVYRPIGESGSGAASKETTIIGDDGYVYSVDQTRPVISRANVAEPAKLESYIAGSATRLRAPIGIAVDSDGKLCALDDETLFVLCYAPGAKGNVSPLQSIDTKSILGYGQVDDVAFGKPGQLVVAGTSDRSGLGGFSIAVFEVAGCEPRLLRKVGGANTRLRFPDSVAVDGLGDILVLQKNSTEFNSGSQVIAFGPEQRGDVPPIAIRDPATSTSHALRMAVDRRSGDVAVLASDGVAYFRRAANRLPDDWPEETILPLRGWDVAFAGNRLILANEFGVPLVSNVAQALKSAPIVHTAALSLHDPEFVSTDQEGHVYVASTDGVISALPSAPDKDTGITAVFFRTPFGRNMSAFAVDSAGYSYLSSASNNAIVVVGPRGQQSVIGGSNTQLKHPIGLAVGKDGTLFVANADGRNILKFARGSTGDVAPIGQIAGRSSALIAPQALAIDSAGKLYVFDGPITAAGYGAQHYVRVYDAQGGGDIAPLESYPVQTKCWVNAP